MTDIDSFFLIDLHSNIKTNLEKSAWYYTVCQIIHSIPGISQPNGSLYMYPSMRILPRICVHARALTCTQTRTYMCNGIVHYKHTCWYLKINYVALLVSYTQLIFLHNSPFLLSLTTYTSLPINAIKHS